jgi:(1->4)-alpha-D-glucan 1-alpha-D-glucosylmutase
LAEAEFVVRFQQLSGPTRAKGCEDTAWYRLVALISRCEVGSNPDDWGLALASFHSAMVERQSRWPGAMTSITTHDSKRSADVRARIDSLSQWPAEFARVVGWWWSRAGLGPMPSFDLYALQTVLGTPGLDRARLDEHLVKALREAKQATSWLRPDELVEGEVLDRVHLMLDEPDMASRIQSLAALIEPVARAAIVSHAVLAVCLPGVPDLYQGTETWHHRLVDPDNREPVDPAPLATDLAALGDVTSPLPVAPSDPLAKVAVTRLALNLRERCDQLFGPDGTYRPIWASGAQADHAVVFARGNSGNDDGQVVVVVPRLGRGIADGWGDTVVPLPAGRWVNLCTGDRWTGTVLLDDLLAVWPIALLERVP